MKLRLQVLLLLLLPFTVSTSHASLTDAEVSDLSTVITQWENALPNWSSSKQFLRDVIFSVKAAKSLTKLANSAFGHLFDQYLDQVIEAFYKASDVILKNEDVKSHMPAVFAELRLFYAQVPKKFKSQQIFNDLGASYVSKAQTLFPAFDTAAHARVGQLLMREVFGSTNVEWPKDEL